MRLTIVGGTSAALFIVIAAAPAAAATLCVSPGGHDGCFATISAAVAAASPGDTIQIAHGTYAETVTIAKPVSLVGANRHNTRIDATGLPYGIVIDGLGNPGLADVSVTGLTINGANFEGILVTNATRVTIADDIVENNDRNLAFPNCPGLLPPDSQEGEGFDCGEGIHLVGVDHSTISSNIVVHNAGGVLLSDETGPTHDNLISGNTVDDNVFDCGVTLASHRPVPPNGIFHNTIARNDVSRNGTQGAGAGVGMFAPIPGTATYGNIVIGNTAVGNGIPGIALHSHDVDQNLNDNAIIGNYVADNGPDDDAETPGSTGIVVFGVSPITGTIISGNIIEREDIAIAVKTDSVVAAHLNAFDNHAIGVANLDGGAVDATLNWWGCSRGPGAPGCSGVSGPDVAVSPWLRTPIQSRR